MNATSAAFAALTHESYARAHYLAAARGDEDELLAALEDLHDAAHQWNSALCWLATYREIAPPEDEDLEASVLSAASETGCRHYLLVGQLAVRLVHELSALTGTQVQVYVGWMEQTREEGTR